MNSSSSPGEAINGDPSQTTKAKQSKARSHRATREGSEIDQNPCAKEYGLSLKCLADNLYDSKKCEEAFENYKICKGFWQFVVHERRGTNTKPYLPPVEEREEVKKQYIPKYIR